MLNQRREASRLFLSKKRFKALEKRVADLEGQVQGQQKVIDYLHVDVSKSPKQAIEEAVHEALYNHPD